MIRLFQVWIFNILFFGAASCVPAQAELDAYAEVLYAPSYASGFEIVGAKGMKSSLLKISDPWQGAENTETMLFIARDGEKAPKNFSGQIIETSAARIVCMSSTHVAMLDVLGQSERIVGVSGRDYISNDYVISHKDSVADVGFDGNVDYEKLWSLNPDLVLLFGVNGASGLEPKLTEMGIPFCYIGEYLEESPLGKAEWLIAVAEIIGNRAGGERIFAPIPERYLCLKHKAAAATRANPKVMINTPYAGSWFMASTESYVARLIADAGGDYIYKKNSSNRSLPIDLEEAYFLVSGADLWINAGSVSSLTELKALFPKFADADCVRNGAVYNCNKRLNDAGGNDYWESGVVHPDVVLHDLIVIFHPELMAENDRELVYYRKLE